MNEIRSLIGKPWDIPCDPPNTFECFALVGYVREIAGKYTPTVIDRMKREYDQAKQISVFAEQWTELDEPVPFCACMIGDSHCGVYLKGGQIIHASQGSGVRIDKVSTLKKVFGVRYMEWEHGAVDHISI